jgi:hypothetical protein
MWFPSQKSIDSELEKKRHTKKRVPVIIEFAKNKKEELSNDRHGCLNDYKAKSR